MYAAQLIAKVGYEGVEETKSKLGEVDKKVKETSGGFGEFAKHALEMAGVFKAFEMAGEGVNFLKEQFVDSIKVAMDHQQVMAQTIQAIKSTGDASGMAAEDISGMAESISHWTEFSAETVQQGENLLLTFTNIGKNVFPLATNAIVDVSQAMGQDLKSSAIQVGKALDDPVKGMTALQRIGVTFDETQKKLVKSYMDHNQVAKAQGVILQELQKEFGGSADAAGRTFGGQLAILGNRFDELKVKMGTALLPILTQFLGFISNNAMPWLTKFSDWFLKNGVPALQNLFTEAQQHLLPLFLKLSDWITGTGLPAFGKFSDWFMRTALPAIQSMANSLETNLLPPLESLIGNVMQAVGQFTNWLFASGYLQDAVSTLSGVLGTLVGWVSAIVGWFNQASPAAEAVKVALEGIGAAILGIKLEYWLQGVITGFSQWKQHAGDLLNWFKGPFVTDMQSTTASVQAAESDIGTTMKTTVAADVATGATEAEASIAGIGAEAEATKGTVATASASMSGALGGVLAMLPLIILGVQKTMDAVHAQAGTLVDTARQFEQQNPGQPLPTLLRQALQDAGIDPNHLPSPTSPGVPPGVDPAWWAKVQGQGAQGGAVRHFASGTSFAPGGPAMLGEREPEVVSGPGVGWLPRGASVTPMSQLGGGETHVHVHLSPEVSIDGAMLTRKMLPEIVLQVRNKTGWRH